MHPDDNCNWDCFDVGCKQRVFEVDEGDGEEEVGVASVSLFWMADAKLVMSG